jgi:hypothetical protein
MDIISFIIGFAIGMIVLALGVELGMKKNNSSMPSSRHAKDWSVSEITNPRIMAEYLGEIEIPKSSKVLVGQYKNKNILKGLDVRENSNIKGNFIVGDDRALILSGPIRENEIGFWTIEKEIVKKLNEQFDFMWSEGTKVMIEE